jgi:PAS domain-containing protein
MASPAAQISEFEAETRQRAFAKGAGLPGRVWETRTPLWIPDVTKDDNFPRAVTAARRDYGAFAFPIRLNGQILEVVEFLSHEVRQPDDAVLQMVETIGLHIAQFIANGRDLTQRKQAEESLRSSEAEFRAIFELAGSGGCQTDPATGRFVRVNPKLCEITGYSSEELLSMTFPQITFAADRQKDLEQFPRRFEVSAEYAPRNAISARMAKTRCMFR